MLVSKNVMHIVPVFFGPKNITFGNNLTLKYRTYLPVCACGECPPRGPRCVACDDLTSVRVVEKFVIILRGAEATKYPLSRSVYVTFVWK